ncbi:uncharacterized protein PFL1_06095 [Pseudozyma flocculosa PF-1]|uniref:Uncharacterized protein n=2 Tax=Pseudozyma flocculosa TaxID=84751 RepID=A0A5C3F3E1_9BASI|nr:uncharacterized protein PFL1_06095 [Pseudozyma flocculosa PF-1]EPQ26447.1 hypothetical protein PFL1_06095 [Pseudozyma flocculosa PF-1]SPO38958.1 uncharacterized protein PSFLO_04437 [Pseudozyma flocculosa]
MKLSSIWPATVVAVALAFLGPGGLIASVSAAGPFPSYGEWGAGAGNAFEHAAGELADVIGQGSAGRSGLLHGGPSSSSTAERYSQGERNAFERLERPIEAPRPGSAMTVKLVLHNNAYDEAQARIWAYRLYDYGRVEWREDSQLLSRMRRLQADADDGFLYGTYTRLGQKHLARCADILNKFDALVDGEMSARTIRILSARLDQAEANLGHVRWVHAQLTDQSTKLKNDVRAQQDPRGLDAAAIFDVDSTLGDLLRTETIMSTNLEARRVILGGLLDASAKRKATYTLLDVPQPSIRLAKKKFRLAPSWWSDGKRGRDFDMPPWLQSEAATSHTPAELVGIDPW